MTYLRFNLWVDQWWWWCSIFLPWLDLNWLTEEQKQFWTQKKRKSKLCSWARVRILESPSRGNVNKHSSGTRWYNYLSVYLYLSISLLSLSLSLFSLSLSLSLFSLSLLSSLISWGPLVLVAFFLALPWFPRPSPAPPDAWAPESLLEFP